jgi:menaquinone-dependent protoporphyrinogen oxidase
LYLQRRAKPCSIRRSSAKSPQRQPEEAFPLSNVLLLYFSVYGQTRKICERLKADLAASGVNAELAPLTEPPADLDRYDAIVIGASIRHGKHNPAVFDFIAQHRALLDAKPSGFFSVNLVARKPAKNTPQTNPYVKAFVSSTPWTPRLLGVFGGNLDYQRYKPFDRAAIRFIMWITRGPTDPHTNVEFTDWDAVRRFAGQVAALAGRTAD